MTIPDLQKPSEAEALMERSKLRHERRVSRVSGHLWRCTSYRRGIYTFTLRDEFNPNIHPDANDRMTQVLKKLYPAIEPTPKEILELYNFRYYKKDFINEIVKTIFQPIREWIDGMDKDQNEIIKGIKTVCEYLENIKTPELAQKFSSIDPLLNRKKYIEALPRLSKTIKRHLPIHLNEFFIQKNKKFEFFNQLGFSAKSIGGQVTLKIPSIAKLQKRWKNIQPSQPGLPQLRIYSCRGIANDLDFVKTYLSHDVLVSRDKELIHDYIVHLHSVILLNYENPDHYKKTKALIVEQINNIYEKIIFAKEHLIHSGEESNSEDSKTFARSINKLEITLGLAVDIISTHTRFKEIPNEIPQDVKFHFHLFLAGIMQTPDSSEYLRTRLGNNDIHLDYFKLKSLFYKIDIEMKKWHNLQAETQN